MANERDDDEGVEDEQAHKQRRRVERPPAADYRDDDSAGDDSAGDDSASDDDRPRRRRRRERDDRDDEPSIGDDVGMRMLLPVGRSIWAIISGYLGLLSILCFPAPFALITGIVAIIEIRNNPKKHGMGRAIFGIIMGTLGSIALAITLVFMLLERRRF